MMPKTTVTPSENQLSQFGASTLYESVGEMRNADLNKGDAEAALSLFNDSSTVYDKGRGVSLRL